MLNLDTHILVFALQGTLRPKEEKWLAGESWGISSIVFWELSKLIRLGRLVMDLRDPAVRRALGRLHVFPIDLDVCLAIDTLDFRSDPADEIIAATSVVHQVSLVTRDHKLLKSKIVPILK